MTIPTKIYETPPKGFKPKVNVSGAFLFFGGKFLILKRDISRPQPLTWGIPSGKQEGKEIPIDTLLREVEEEVGLKLKKSKVKKITTLFVNHPDLDFCYHIFYSHLSKKPKITLDLKEHSEAKWVTYNEAIKLDLIGGAKETFIYCFSLLDKLEIAFKKEKNEKIATWQKNYMRNQFPFIGLQKPKRALIQKEIFNKIPIFSEEELIKTTLTLFEMEEREFAYAAIDLLYHHKALWSDKSIIHFEKLLEIKPWWDTVDLLTSKIIGSFLKKHPEIIPKVDLWTCSNSFWKRRASLLYMLNWREKTDHEKLFKKCLKLAHEKEFFIQKAIGWALRQYARVNKGDVLQFVEAHKEKLASLSVREAIKRL